VRLILVMMTALLLTCSTSSNVPTSEATLASIKTAAMDGGYRADLAQLRDAARKAKAFQGDVRMAPLAHYWAGYALWQRALNGVNRDSTPAVVRADLEEALTQLDLSLLLRPDFADAHVLAGMVHGWMILIEPPKLTEHVTRMRAHLGRAKELEPDSPRVRWAEATNLLNAPPQFGGDRAKALALFREIAAASAGKPSAAAMPDWGVAESQMSLAFGLSNGAAAELPAARTAAAEALKLRPDWYYVHDILLPQIAAKEGAQ
jgi:hypothetical protein